MSKKSIFVSVVAACALVISSCNKEEPFVKPKLSFSATTKTVNEADQTIEIELVLDKAFSEDLTIDYVLSGAAKDKTSAAGGPYDYEITSEYLETEILKGETTGIIEIKLYSDFSFEDDEVFEITIEDISNDNIEITRDDEITVTIKQEDGLLVFLDWGVGAGENYTDVDMDLFLWAENTSGTLELTGVGSANASFNSPEFFFIPTAPLPDGNYGLSCTYYEGTEDPMNFLITFIEVVNNDDASTTEIQGAYTLANLNKWDVDDREPLLIQTFDKVGTDFTNFSSVTVPGQYSRAAGKRLPVNFMKHGVVNLPAIERLNR